MENKLINDIYMFSCVDDQREVYRGSLVPVQKLRLLDENSAVFWKARGIRNWTIHGLTNNLKVH